MVAVEGGEGLAVLVSGTMVDHFKVVRLAGRGGMGEVYLARDTKLGRKVALKLVHREALGDDHAVERFLHEARTTAQFSHPHIVTVHSVGEVDLPAPRRGSQDGDTQPATRCPYVALEWLEGQTLRERIDEQLPGPKETMRLGLAIAEALGEAHAHGVLHRDLKPENVLVGKDGRLRVLDFGLAKLTYEQQASTQGETETEAMSLLAAQSTQSASFKTRGGLAGTPAYMAPEQWTGAELTSAVDMWAFGLVLYELLCGQNPFRGLGRGKQALFAIGARIVSDEPVPPLAPAEPIPARLGELVGQCLDKAPEKRPSAADAAGTLRSLLYAGGTKRDTEESPFRGLLPFTEDQADLFFGRDAEVARFVERLRTEPVLPVVGPSGAGKSSFVQAGVIPRLREQGRWLVLSLRPGRQPIDALAHRLAQAEAGEVSADSTGDSGQARAGAAVPSPRPSSRGVAGPVASSQRAGPAAVRAGGDLPRAEDLAKLLADSPGKLGLHLQQLAEAHDAGVLLFVDQLEELFALAEDEAVRGAFVEAICRAADDPAGPVRVVFTLRDDFQWRMAETELGREVLSHVTVLRSPGAEALEETVVRPLRAVGYELDDGALVGEMAASVKGEAAALALLQVAADLLWDRRDATTKKLLRAAYEDIGGVAGAVAKRADQVLDGLTPDELGAARQLLLRLVTPEGTRRVLARAELLGGLDSAARGVLDRLIQGRVLGVRKGPSGGLVELVHESLVRNWDLLRRWIEEGKEQIAFLSEATQAAELWEKRGKAPEEVWRGEALALARNRARQTGALPELVRQFLEAGDAEDRRGQRRKRAIATAGILVLGLIAVVAVVVSFALRSREQTAVREKANAEREKAKAERKQAEALFEGARAAVERSDPIAARAQLRASLEIDDSLAARALWPLARDPSSMWSISLGEPLTVVASLRDGRSVAAAGGRNGFVVDLTTLEVARVPELGAAYALEMCPDGKMLAVGHTDGRVALLPIPRGPERVLGTLEGIARSVACSGDSRYVVASGEKDVRVWDVADNASPVVVGSCQSRCPVAASTHELAYSSGDELYVRPIDASSPAVLLSSRPGGYARLRMDASGGTIIAQRPDGTVETWDTRERRLLRSTPWSPTAVSPLVLDPDGRLAGTCDAVECAIWATATGDIVARGTVPAVSFPRSSDFVAELGVLVFVPDAASEIVVWPWATKPRFPVSEGSGEAGISPSGTEIACASQSTGITLRSVATGRRNRSLPTRSYGVAYDLSGERLIVPAISGKLELWDARSAQRLAAVSAHRGYAYAASAQPGGSLWASAGVDGVVRLLDGASLDFVGAPMRHSGSAISVAFSPDGRRLVSTSWDRTVRIWDVKTQKSQHVLPIDALGMVARFSPDGSLVAASMRGGDGVAVWRTSDWSRQPAPPRPGPSNIYGLAFHPDGQRLALGPIDGIARVWSLRTGETVALVGHHDAVNRVDFSPDGRLVLTTSDDDTVRTWDPDTGHPFWRAPLMLTDPARALTQQGWLELANVDAPPKPLETKWAKAVHELAREAAADAPLTHVCLRSHDGELRIWDTVADREALVLPMPGLSRVVALPSGCAVIARDEARLVTSAGASTLLVTAATAIAADHGELLVAAGQEVVAFDATGKRVSAWPSGAEVSAMARVGDWLVIGRSGGQLALVPLASEKPAGASSFEGLMASPVLRIVQGPRDTLVVGYRNGAVGVWDPVTGRRLDVWYLHGPAIHVLVEGTTLYAISELAEPTKQDLSVLERDYCDLMRELWRTVPVVWEAGKAVKREPPAGHRCAP